jgi:hypothetical protein
MLVEFDASSRRITGVAVTSLITRACKGGTWHEIVHHILSV